MAPRTRGQVARENSPEKAAAATPAKAPRPTKAAAKKNTPRKTALKRAAEIVETEQVEVESTVQTPLKESSTESSVSARRIKHVEIEIPIPTSTTKAQDPDTTMEGESQLFQTPTEQPRGKRITFDDSEQEEFVTPREAPDVNPLEERLNEKKEQQGQSDEDSEEEDSDDEAPEAVSTHAAQAKSLEAEKAAQKAAEQQAAAEKKRRQERDAILKEQAKSKKRAAKKVEQPSEDEAESESEEEAAGALAEKRKREIPKLLPLELLESDDEDDEVPRRSDSAEGAKRRKVVREAKGPKDEKVGSTVFRVVPNNTNQSLAPKVKRQALNLKETLLLRNRKPQVKGGFFRR
ncbi:hypothetical protein GE21DRAFT_4927 [Neurospora crassa]|uniref:U3 snoRNA associated n=1 Tax=Neurospora crassa (strain ATCC 24698 / 74-OR23-1A / CBS 708.71 / DSM 1257 / FGSC 987) TaxID=367110 RepID=Q7S2Z8_NEUCR|nr:hypothetical protein NCU07551 [Neurospora crassa OR74A]EAA29828.1 hypothetical protein NCU07551 [Neurospora crassa OR74A]KHE81703.1 hypothetical protein GE21DRAFT_4927 [Neurospora crassa]|eukprot:XP_959064.1 hypothetical protein NCU07551 [Neurospora crassa OR74A]